MYVTMYHFSTGSRENAETKKMKTLKAMLSRREVCKETKGVQNTGQFLSHLSYFLPAHGSQVGGSSVIMVDNTLIDPQNKRGLH